ncbi:MAG: DUF447 family protein [Pirellulaceae bacterium]
MILESLVTSRNDEGVLNIAPMGPSVDRELQTIELRPFKSSTTYANLLATSTAVVHVIDDVLLIARAATGTIENTPAIRNLQNRWTVLEAASRWLAVEIVQWIDDDLRPTAKCRICHQGTGPPFFGFNRGKHAVIEAAILATRTHLLPLAEIQHEFERLQILVDKTGGDQEHEAFRLLRASVDRSYK